MKKIDKLAKSEGYDNPEDMVTDKGLDGVVPAICMNPDCDHTETMEPDQSKGWCPDCQSNTMKSCLVLMGLI